MKDCSIILWPILPISLSSSCLIVDSLSYRVGCLRRKLEPGADFLRLLVDYGWGLVGESSSLTPSSLFRSLKSYPLLVVDVGHASDATASTQLHTVTHSKIKLNSWLMIYLWFVFAQIHTPGGFFGHHRMEMPHIGLPGGRRLLSRTNQLRLEVVK